MPYIGNQSGTTGFSKIPAKQDLTGATGSTLTLSNAVSSPESIDLFINHVRQEPTESYTIDTNGTTVNLVGYTVAATDDIYVVYNSLAQQTSTHPSNQALQATSGTFSGAVTANSFSGDGSALTNIFSPSYAVVSDQKTSGVAGGSSSTSYVTRDLNAEVFDPDNIVTVASNQFTLIAGTYIIEWECPHYRSNAATTVLYDVTGSANVETGTSGYSNTSNAVTVGLSTGIARVVIASSNTYDIRMKCSAAFASAGFGIAANQNPETYTVVKITKIA